MRLAKMMARTMACAVLLGCGVGDDSTRVTGAWTVDGSPDDTEVGDTAPDDGDDDGDAGGSDGCSSDCDSTSGSPGTTQGDGGPSLSFLEPSDGATVLNPVGFEVVGQGVEQVDMIIDGTVAVPLDWDLSVTAGYVFTYSFAEVGSHRVELRGYAEGSALVLAETSMQITVEGEPGDGGTTGDSGDTTDMPTALCDGIDAEPLITPTNCDGPNGNTTTEIPDNHKYATSWFGCYFQDNGSIYMDPYDNCEFACGNMGLCPAGQSGPECEANLKWFAANADRYGCGGRIRVTNCDNGRSVILATLDRGPNCNTVEKSCNTPVLDMSHDAMDHLFEGSTYGGCDHQAVVVEQVADDAPLGPS